MEKSDKLRNFISIKTLELFNDIFCHRSQIQISKLPCVFMLKVKIRHTDKSYLFEIDGFKKIIGKNFLLFLFPLDFHL